LQKKFVVIAKQKNVIDGIVVTHYTDMIVAQCHDYESDGNVRGYKEYKRTAKQSKPLMKGLSQEF
jgi:hypothetical protein